MGKGAKVEPIDDKDDDVEVSTWDGHVTRVLAACQDLYQTRIRPLEDAYEYDTFDPTWFAEGIAQRRPFVTFLGPFSTGKSTFINYLLQDNILLTGPQPVTDKFTVIMHGDSVQEINGRVLMTDSRMPFRALSQFGDAFKEAFRGITVPHPILRSVNFVDSPGVLETDGQIRKRRYDYIKVCQWFCEKSDLIFIMFDPTKLDAGNELRMMFKHAIKNNEGKVRIILNKADTVKPKELMRIYGAIFWNLSNLIRATEPPRVYISSFWDRPYAAGTDHSLFSNEKGDLLYELIEEIPLQSLDSRIADVAARGNRVLVHAWACATIRDRMPSCCGQAEALEKEIAASNTTFGDIAIRQKLAARDFAHEDEYRTFFRRVNIMDMSPLSKMKKTQRLDKLRACIDEELPMLLKPIHDTPVPDPRNRREALMMHREYQGRIQSQQLGVPGIQGALGFEQAHTAPFDPHAVSDLPVSAPTNAVAQNMFMQNMIQMMQQQMLLQYQQQEQQQDSSEVATTGGPPSVFSEQHTGAAIVEEPFTPAENST